MTDRLKVAAQRVVELCPVATDAYTRAQYEEASAAMDGLRAAIAAEGSDQRSARARFDVVQRERDQASARVVVLEQELTKLRRARDQAHQRGDAIASSYALAQRVVNAAQALERIHTARGDVVGAWAELREALKAAVLLPDDPEDGVSDRSDT